LAGLVSNGLLKNCEKCRSWPIENWAVPRKSKEIKNDIFLFFVILIIVIR
jgi:hypothetical protein